MVGGRHALVDRLLQLRRPAGHLLGLPAAGKRAASDYRATRSAGVGLRVGVRTLLARRGHDRRSRAAQVRHPGGTGRLEPHLYGHRGGAQFPGAGLLSRRRRVGRDVLLSGVGVAGQRLSRRGNALARAGAAPDQRIHRYHRGRIFRRRHRPALRVALVVSDLRRPRGAARRVVESLPARTSAARGRRADAAGRLSCVWSGARPRPCC